INEMSYGGQKSSSPGIDLDFRRDGARYLVTIKSGPNWGNKDQYASLRVNFRNAVKVLRQSPRSGNILAVLGICYGKSKKRDTGDYIKICGQSFWEFISGEPNLYIDLIEPLGYQAKRHNDRYVGEKSMTINRLVREFANEFCDSSGRID